MTPRREAVWLAVILALALVLRFARWDEERRSPLGRAPSGDEHGYDQWAKDIVRGVPYEVPYNAPLQAWSLAAWYSVLPLDQARNAQRGLHVLLGAGTAALAWALGRRLGGPRVGLVSAGAVALHVPLVYYETTLLREGPGTFLTALAVFVHVRAVDLPGGASPAAIVGRWLVVGLVWGLAALCRENLLLVALAALLVQTAIAARARPGRALGLAAGAAAALGLFLPSLPLLHRNAGIEGRWALLPTWNGGGAFYMSNRRDNPSPYYAPLPFSRIPSREGDLQALVAEAERRHGRPLTPHQVSSYWLWQGAHDVLADPVLYARKVAWRSLWYCASAEIGGDTRDMRLEAERSRVLVVPSVGFGLLTGFALVGAWVLRRRAGARLLGGVVLLLFLSTVSVIFCTRYRLPAVPLLAPLAACGARAAVGSLRAGRPGRLALAASLGLAFTAAPVPYGPGYRITAQVNRALVLLELGEPGGAFAELEGIPERAMRGEAWGKIAAALLQNDEVLPAADASRRAAADAPARAPLLAQLWEDRAQAREARGDQAGARAARAVASELASVVSANRPG